ncbi:hypothetical protein V6N11_045163 [Hibiscus sabdariffa]|uniref:Uncharacterized protein n=1 Tax=Hibiscus sabdariffa TaxID=183260 RepID=A0ABR1ZS49_9ROSI
MFCSVGSKGTRKLRLVLLLSTGVAIVISALIFWLVYLHKGSKGQWKIDSFIGFQRFKANDLNHSMDELPLLPAAVCKVMLSIGVTALVKKMLENRWKINDE